MSIADKFETIADAVYDKGVTDGKKSEYKEFWDNYLNNNGHFGNAFAGYGWNKDTFKPPSGTVIQPLIVSQTFGNYALLGIDLVEVCEELGITIDFSKATTLTEPFIRTGLARVGIIDTRSCNALTSIFAYTYSYLKTVDKVILKADGTQTWGNNSFIAVASQIPALEEIRFEGVIGNSKNHPTLNLQWLCNISKGSIESFINALSDEANGNITLSKAAIKNAYGIDVTTDTDIPIDNKFYTLRYSKSNWTFAYA